MKAVKLQPPPPGASPYSSENPATAAALHLKYEIPKPVPSSAGELLVRIKATAVVRDNLSWPEMYQDPPAQLGNDFSGVVAAVSADGRDEFKIGDEIYGMTGASRGGTWAEYAVVKPAEAYLKPSILSWEEAAALPLTAMTADQALFDHANLALNANHGRRQKVLITGAAGNVGTILVLFAATSGHRVVAAASSSRQNEVLFRLGAERVVDYSDLDASEKFDVIIDTKGGTTLRACWELIADGGSLVSVDSSSWNFVEEHKQLGLTANKSHVHAVFFVVEPSKRSMERVTNAVLAGHLHGMVSRIMPLQEVQAAYMLCHSRDAGRGKIILLP